MLDIVGARVDEAGHQLHALGQLEILEHLPFVRVARISGLDRDGANARLEQHVDDVAQGDVVVMRALVVAPARVQAHPLFG
jgi:hypothetical protein